MQLLYEINTFVLVFLFHCKQTTILPQKNQSLFKKFLVIILY